jgi:hypothetical protein
MISFLPRAVAAASRDPLVCRRECPRQESNLDLPLRRTCANAAHEADLQAVTGGSVRPAHHRSGGIGRDSARFGHPNRTGAQTIGGRRAARPTRQKDSSCDQARLRPRQRILVGLSSTTNKSPPASTEPNTHNPEGEQTCRTKPTPTPATLTRSHRVRNRHGTTSTAYSNGSKTSPTPTDPARGNSDQPPIAPVHPRTHRRMGLRQAPPRRAQRRLRALPADLRRK